jgi:tetratricopeptide (TPR) repeat protein
MPTDPALWQEAIRAIQAQGGAPREAALLLELALTQQALHQALPYARLPRLMALRAFAAGPPEGVPFAAWLMDPTPALLAARVEGVLSGWGGPWPLALQLRAEAGLMPLAQSALTPLSRPGRFLLPPPMALRTADCPAGRLACLGAGGARDGGPAETTRVVASLAPWPADGRGVALRIERFPAGSQTADRSEFVALPLPMGVAPRDPALALIAGGLLGLLGLALVAAWRARGRGRALAFAGVVWAGAVGLGGGLAALAAGALLAPEASATLRGQGLFLLSCLAAPVLLPGALLLLARVGYRTAWADLHAVLRLDGWRGAAAGWGLACVLALAGSGTGEAPGAAALGFCIGLSLSGQLLVRAYDPSTALRMRWFGLAGLLAALLLLAWLGPRPAWMIPALVALAGAVRLTARSGAVATEPAGATPSWDRPAAETEAAGALAAAADRVVAGESVWLRVVGPEGAGKARLISHAIAGRAPGAHVVWIRPGEAGEPMQPIMSLLTALAVPIGKAAEADPLRAQLDSAAASLLGPVATLLSLGQGDPARQALIERVLAVEERIRTLTAERPLFVVITSVEQLDPASWSFLDELHGRMAATGAVPLGVFLAGPPRSDLPAWLKPLALVPVRELEAAEQVALLRDHFGLTPRSAADVAAWLSGGDPVPFGRVASAVKRLEQEGLLVASGFGRALRVDMASLPAPPSDTMRALVSAEPALADALLLLALAPDGLGADEIATAFGQPALPLARGLARLAEIGGPLTFDARLRRFGFKAPLRAREMEGLLTSGSHAGAVSPVAEATLARVLLARSPASVSDLIRAGQALARAGAPPEEIVRVNVSAAREARRAGVVLQARSALDLARPHLAAVGPELASAFADEMFITRLAISAMFDRPLQEEVEGVIGWAEAHPAASPEARLAVARFLAHQVTRRMRRDLLPRARAILDELLAPAGAQPLALAIQAGAWQVAALLTEQGSAERIAALRHGLRAARAMDRHLPLRAQLADALGQCLVFGDEQQRKRGARLLRWSIRIKQGFAFPDLAGIARSLGGLGRALMEISPPDIPGARAAFTENLEISQRLGDRKGVAKMRCHLGQCDQAEGRLNEAREHFEACLLQSDNPLDRAFAFRGLLELAAYSADAAGFDAYLSRLERETELLGQRGAAAVMSFLQDPRFSLPRLPSNYSATFEGRIVGVPKADATSGLGG